VLVIAAAVVAVILWKSSRPSPALRGPNAELAPAHPHRHLDLSNQFVYFMPALMVAIFVAASRSGVLRDAQRPPRGDRALLKVPILG